MKQLVEDYIAGKIPPPAVAASLGMEMMSGGNGESVFRYVADGRHANPMGTLHGGVLCDLADGAMGMALASTLEEGESFTTLDLHVSFLRPVWNATLTAKARTVHRGKTRAVMECDVYDEKERHIARVGCTQMILSGDAAKGR